MTENTAPTPGGPHGRLDRSLMSGVAWTGLGRGVVQAVSWATTLLVARLLRPEDYGLVGMASVFFWALQSLGEFGLGASILKQRDLTEDQIAQVNGLSILLGLASAATAAAMAGPLAVFFAAPELHEIVPVSALTFIVASFRTVPSAMMQRDFRFRRLALNDTMLGISTAGGVLVFALLGLGYWSLVLGNLLGMGIGTAMLVNACPHRFAWPRTRAISQATTFGREVLVSRFAWYAMFNADFLVAGRKLGKGPLGNYTVAWSVASLPVEKIATLVSRVAMPLFSAVQHDRGGLKRYLLLMTEGLALLTFPLAIGIGLVADMVMPLLLGPRWAGVVPPLQALAFVVPVRSVGILLPQIVPMIGRTRYGMYHALLSAGVMTTAFLVGSRWGTSGIAAAWAVAYPLTLLPLLRMVLAAADCRPGEYLAAMRPAVAGCLVLAGAVIGTRVVLPADTPGVMRAVAAIAAGGVAYTVTVWRTHGPRLGRLVELVRSGRGGMAR